MLRGHAHAATTRPRLQQRHRSDDEQTVGSTAPTLRPRIRAAIVQANLQSLEGLGSEARGAVIDALGPRTVAQIEDSTRMGWLPLEVDARMSQAVVEVVGRDVAIAWTLTSLRETLASPLFATFVGSTLRLFGFGPVGILKMAPRLWRQAYRGMGRIEIAGDEEGARCVRLTGGPALVVDDDMYLWGLGESLAATLLIVGVEAEVVHRRVGPGHAEWDVRWPARAR